MNTQKTILLADDEFHVTHLLARKLEAAGYSVVIARDGREAMDLASEHMPDLIITDLQMPHMSGLELAKAIYQDHPSVPIIMLTARGYLVGDSEISMTNIQTIVPKPFSTRRVLGMVIEIFENGSLEKSSRDAA